ncbi:phage family protein [Acinetobacter sp. 723929]|uniref:Gp49 family protein n=1 Tax=Acinetobacter sp. 723929 TaxID=1310711 RepID=UPI000451DF44|nr:Gp49 family protein [Acinetobacter sp. 723929]EXI13957.1 phage family protein [Acinetobacter sp. 723929]
MIKEVTEQELAEKSVAPRVTKAQIDSLMERVTYTVEQRPGGTTSTFVGFSACVNAENFDAEIGERMARGNAEKSAENKLWELEGYRLFATNY